MKFDIAGALPLRCTGADRNRDFGMNKRVMMKSVLLLLLKFCCQEILMNES